MSKQRINDESLFVLLSTFSSRLKEIRINLSEIRKNKEGRNDKPFLELYALLPLFRGTFLCFRSKKGTYM